MDHISARSKQRRNIVQLCTIGQVEDYKDNFFVVVDSYVFFLQDLKYVLLRLQKAITKVEQGMKVTFFKLSSISYRSV